MKLTRKRILIGMVVLAGVTYGCEDFLTTPPQGQLDALTLANASGVEATLIGAYRMLGGWIGGVGLWGASASNWPFGSVPSDDAYKGSEASDQPAINDLELYQWGTSGAETYLNAKWRSVFEAVVRANSTLRLLAAVEQTPGELTEAQANSIRGEALFLRAHAHFEAWKVWKNIPYYTEDDTDFRESNQGVDPIPLILADLDQAIGLLPPTPRNGEVGRVTEWTAKAYKGRVQAYSGDYAGTLETLRDVADNGPYQLEANFHRVWTGFAEFANGPETILAYQATVNDGSPSGDNSNWAERLNFPHSGSPFGCCGFHQPSQNMVNFFKVDAAGLPLAISGGDLTPLTATASWNASDAELEGGSTIPVDPRLDWTVGRDGVPYKDWGVHEPDWIRDPTFGGPYSPKKHVHEEASGAVSNVGWNAQHLNAVNIHLYRYADLLLLLAEAEVEAGSLENARVIVNQIRARAGVAAQGPGTSADDIAVPIDDPSITWADYEIGEYASFPTQEYARSAVRYERRLELAMEGHRLFDLQRWGIIEPVLNDYIAVEATRMPHLGAAATVTDVHNVFPIPPVQIELSRVGGENRLVQNPGW
ncbi:MAG: RagB/SusD family nutrient uptake outer membrane protein [Gemmatimonadetes bacterium]|nr:RagB/SusD family nutrient uptake outer membrane protein [Gemmatimonadota bacterium]